MAGPHRIRRLAWRVRTRSTPQAFALRGELRDALGSRLLAAMGEAFDRAATGDEVVHIDRLDVRMRVKDLASLDAVLAGEVSQAVSRELAARPRAGVARPSSPALLFHFLTTGALPWFAAGAESEHTLALLRAEARDYWQEAVLRLSALDDAAMAAGFFRLLHLRPEPEWTPAAAFVAGRAPARSASADWPAVMAMLIRDETVRGKYQRQRLGAAILVLAWHGVAAATAEELSVAIRRADVAGPAQAEWATGEFTRWLRGSPQSVADARRVEAGWRAPRAPGDLPEAVSAPRPDAVRPEREPARDVMATPFATPVACAGLVLLVPFLRRFFESTRVIAAGRADLPAAVRPRAAALLVLAATGEVEPEEFDLGFIKVLLGLGPEAPLPLAPGLTSAEDAAEADAMVSAMIGHWSALGRASVSGVRAAFLSRPGLLRDDEDGWRLHVEPQAHDVLIGRLPWAISTTTLPWLTKPIFTDWPTR